MAPMTGLLMLVMIVAAGIVLAAVVALRAGKKSTHVGRENPSHSPTNAPAAAEFPDSAPESTAVTPPQTEAPPLPEPAGVAATLAEADTASLNSGGEPAATGTLSDTSDLDFSLAPPVADTATPTGSSATQSAAPSTPAAPAPRTDKLPTATPVQPAAAALSTPTTRAALVSGTTPPEGPQVLQPTEIFAKLFDLALGKARPASSVTAAHQEVAAATAAALHDAATQQRYAPRRPNMLPRVLSASNDDSFSRRDLAALIAQDPSLVGNLLKIANSSYYRVTPEPVESVDRAVVLLGTDGIRSLV